ncbi:DUF2834 domain-containing protein [Mycobacterium sp. 1165178.9]|uniref:DUF2834 domain-containing protein n=1 Tax=Mycobacterium sp. 1165178.9 TaxID=1834070 RepID=UPI0008009687|nr:DUF2834 domain-containing protein [Mycobacterium sp. 1165178.9]OBK65555.1 hypothetical protein A5652_00180 [Mycobacterium sp. 1165178.9]
MTTADRADEIGQASSMPISRKVLCGVYGVIAIAALIATWSQIGPYLHSPADFLGTFWRDVKVNSASRFIAADALMLALSATILMVIEARKHNVRFVWLYVVGSFFIAVSVMFPLFLIARELRIGASEAPPLRSVDTILLAVVAVAAAGLTTYIELG